ncbi:hypothetical protein Q9L42_020210 (plasmid) [Methylomarinum sp. Ch1-1]|uniref:Uncharacterized protein n=1 Tax=Methylomarinum roseum TaxID=3067653 RepID=A0AAU7P0A8_9GAMM|nr:hypothetical protein [Methylomarinum sp. Ch1-1]MDP4523240.1 hypothetical protein [Methylomarinum sp. Ch1-1]
MESRLSLVDIAESSGSEGLVKEFHPENKKQYKDICWSLAIAGIAFDINGKRIVAKFLDAIHFCGWAKRNCILLKEMAPIIES